MMNLPTTGTSTSVARDRAAVKHTDSDKVEVITISDDDEDDVERIPVQRQRLRYNITGTFDECQQLFGARCQVKLTRCQIPANFVAVSKVTAKEEDSSDDDEEDDVNLAAVSKVTVKEDDSSDDEEEDAHANSSSSRGNEETCQTADAASSTNIIVPKLDKSLTGSSSDEEEVPEVLAAEKQQRKKKRGRKPKSTVKDVDCPICGKTFKVKRYLKAHIRRIHTEKKNNQGKIHKCEHCGRSYRGRDTLSFHKRENANGVCKIKDRAKRSRQEKIEKVAKKVLEEKWRPSGSWTCMICQKSMKGSGNYLDHMRSHAGDRRFKCDQCGKSFVIAKTLTEHLKLHTGIQEFGCVFCGKRFYHEWNLFSHLRIHTEEKPFFCVVTGCGASFRHSGSLKLHRRLIHLKRC